jgi:hypothetical protein
MSKNKDIEIRVKKIEEFLWPPNGGSGRKINIEREEFIQLKEEIDVFSQNLKNLADAIYEDRTAISEVREIAHTNETIVESINILKKELEKLKVRIAKIEKDNDKGLRVMEVEF